MNFFKNKSQLITQAATLRTHHRVDMSGQVYIHDEQRLFIAPLKNISEGGVFIQGLTSLRLGKGVRVVIKCSAMAHPIQAKGRVVRVEDSKRKGSAVQFKELSVTDKTAIQTCVEKNLEPVLYAA